MRRRLLGEIKVGIQAGRATNWNSEYVGTLTGKLKEAMDTIMAEVLES